MTNRNTANRPLPISCYADLRQYHAMEEQHAFYVDMHTNMLHILLGYARELGRPAAVLELGAGTGLFTKKLKALPHIQLLVLEPDQRSIDMLNTQLKGSHITLAKQKAEEMSFKQAFNIIISSFSHDHVQQGGVLAQKIRRALQKNGIYICGMEVLRPYANERQRIAALRAWHGYVISEAKKKNLYQLAALEHEALESGIRKIADFKRDENRFEKEINDGGLHLIQKMKIGPYLIPHIGGVFVYVYQK